MGLTGFALRFVIFIGFLLFYGLVRAQNARAEIFRSNVEYRKAMNREFADPLTTPLTEEGLIIFSALDFFPVKPKYRVVSKLELTPDEKPFEMQRSKGNTGTYRKYGELTFKLNGKTCKLSVYQYLKLLNDSIHSDDLFLPFKDLTNGKQTYGGGRFLDLKIPVGDELIIDFNQAYNPLCCYGNPRYSCPIPPAENHLNIKILAGEKKYNEK